MGLKGLAEGIILQSIEDLWSDKHRGDCIAFFTGREFSICAEIAGMNLSDQIKVLNMVKTVVGNTVNNRAVEKYGYHERGKRPARTARRACRPVHAAS